MFYKPLVTVMVILSLRERERGREREKNTERERETERQTDRQTDRDKDERDRDFQQRMNITHQILLKLHRRTF